MAKAKPSAARRGKGSPKDKPKQQYIAADMAPPTVPEIDDLADDYVAARDARMEMLEKETDLQDQLRLLMKKHALESYEYEGKIVKVVSGDPKVSVRKKKADKPAEVNV